MRTGDTLYGIAWRYGLDYRELAAWNRLGDGDYIRAGQRLNLSRPQQAEAGPSRPSPSDRAAAKAASERAEPPRPTSPIPVPVAPPQWSWPVPGRVVTEFGSEEGPRTGALLEGRLSEPVHAAADGKVVYSGSGLIGYGKLIIVKHNEAFLSAYGHNEALLVAEGEQIRRGQRIAHMGQGPGREPRLHFEIRRNGKPVNPRQYLPAR